MRMLIAVSEMLVANSKLTAAVLAGAMLVSSAPTANALTYTTTGAASQISLGDTLGTGFDKLQIKGASGTIDSSTSSIVLNTLTFTAGVNAIVPATYNNQFSFSESLTIRAGAGGPTGTGTLTVPFNLIINYSDTLTVIGGTALSILVGANYWNIVVNPLTIGPNPGGSLTGLLTAQMSDPPAATPLPAALVLFGSGLGAIGLFSRRRKLRAFAVPAA